MPSGAWALAEAEARDREAQGQSPAVLPTISTADRNWAKVLLTDRNCLAVSHAFGLPNDEVNQIVANVLENHHGTHPKHQSCERSNKRQRASFISGQRVAMIACKVHGC